MRYATVVTGVVIGLVCSAPMLTRLASAAEVAVSQGKGHSKAAQPGNELPDLEILAFIGEWTDENGQDIDFETLQSMAAIDTKQVQTDGDNPKAVPKLNDKQAEQKPANSAEQHDD